MNINSAYQLAPAGTPPRPGHVGRHNDTEQLPDAWLDYGQDDPLEAYRWISACAACGIRPVLPPQAKSVNCACGSCGPVGQSIVEAVAGWNASSLSMPQSYRDLPFFHLADLQPLQARSHLIGLVAHLKREHAKMAGRVDRKLPVSDLYRTTLEAFIAWATHGLDLIRAETAGTAAESLAA